LLQILGRNVLVFEFSESGRDAVRALARSAIFIHDSHNESFSSRHALVRHCVAADVNGRIARNLRQLLDGQGMATESDHGCVILSGAKDLNE